jgi:hypothetical protein
MGHLPYINKAIFLESPIASQAQVTCTRTPHAVTVQIASVLRTLATLATARERPSWHADKRPGADSFDLRDFLGIRTKLFHDTSELV